MKESNVDRLRDETLIRTDLKRKEAMTKKQNEEKHKKQNVSSIGNVENGLIKMSTFGDRISEKEEERTAKKN